MLNAIKNAFINRVLKHALDGNKGSNILGAILLAIVGAQIDYMKAFEGFKFEDMDKAMESAKLCGAVIAGLYAWFVGRKKATPNG